MARCIYTEILWRHTRLMPDFPNSFGSYNFCVSKKVFDAVGGFNAAYRNASGEDNDLSYKITKAGWRIYFKRKALVDHYHPTRVVKYLREQFRHGFLAGQNVQGPSAHDERGWVYFLERYH